MYQDILNHDIRFLYTAEVANQNRKDAGYQVDPGFHSRADQKTFVNNSTGILMNLFDNFKEKR